MSLITRNIVILIAACIIAYAAAGCGLPYTMNTPDRFAHFHKNKSNLEYISSEGVRLRAHAVKNEPFGDAEMWMRAAHLHLSGTGYHRILEKKVSVSGMEDGIYSEYLFRFNAENHIYAITLFSDRKKIYIIEAGGIKKDFEIRRSALQASISTFSVR